MADSFKTRILVTGASGFLGRHLVPVLEEKYGSGQVHGTSSKEADWTDYGSARDLMERLRPEVFIHLAGYSGGIAANKARPADYFFHNIRIVSNGFQLAAEFGVRKMIYCMCGCAYPADAAVPITEAQMWSGYPPDDNAGYSVAKKTGLVASRSYRTQFGLNSVVLIPSNLYGEYDNFRESESHVIPAMIRRLYEAKGRGDREVKMWGTGKSQRDFVYAGDVARAMSYFVDHYDSSEPVNLSSGNATSILELARQIRLLTGFEGELNWDATKPEGKLFKVLDVARMRGLGLTCETPLSDGLARTIEWFKAVYPTGAEGIRL